jgi:excisionase family DNA binding protein
MEQSNDKPSARYLTVTEVAAALRVSNMTVHRLISAGDLSAVKVGRSVRLRADDVEAYLSGRLIKAG